MSHADFVHLRVHSAYSLSEGAIHIKDLATYCRDERLPAVAITDTNNLFGVLEFSAAMSGKGVQPIVGCQFSVRREEAAGGSGHSNGHSSGHGNGNGAGHGHGLEVHDAVVVLVQNETGYGNLLQLMHCAYRDTETAQQPHVTLDQLEAHNDGLILLTGGPGGPLAPLLAGGQLEAARALTERLQKAFPGRVYMELQRHGLELEEAIEPGLLQLAYDLDIPLVATNEVFFATREMYEAHDALLCIAQAAYLSQSERRRVTPEHYLKSAADMRALFADIPEAADNTLIVAKRCAYMTETRAPILPPYDCGAGRTEADELRAQAEAGLEKRLETQVFTENMTAEARTKAAKPYRERLDYELGVIVEMGFPGYFLIVADFITWAKNRGIPVGPGRGSGAGSVAAWALDITDLDPLRFGLLFERFLNPERISMPDFDVDFCQDRRDEVIRYVQDKYGADQVAQIITFGKLQARAVLRDVGRVLEMPYGQVDRICKLVPNNPASPVTLDQAIKGEPFLQQMIQEDPSVGKLVSIARQLEGLYRHASTHAAGVVIGDRGLDELIPLYRDPRSDMLVTGLNMKWVEAAGLVKFDFLGLKTLTVLSRAVDFVRERGIELDLATLPLDDPGVFEMLGRGDTVGVFQLESAGMRDVLRQLKPTTIEDIIAVVALYRPGPMENIPSYIKRKHGEEQPDYLYPNLEGILKETFGIMIYQEQVMQIAQELAGYTLGAADILRRAMGKKIKAEMDAQRESFVEGATARGVPKAKASQIFDLVAKFAGYGFNKSHAAAYALVAYQTAYFKANYPVEFMAASMSLELHNTDKLNGFRQEVERMNIPLLPPDINASGVSFTVERPGGNMDENAGAIRYALAALKNVGEAAMRALLEQRETGGPFADIGDFARRLDTRAINKRQFENLVRAGAFDSLTPNRRRLFNGIETILRFASAATQDRESDQIGLFGEESMTAPSLTLPDMPDWAPIDRMREEFEAVGFYLSSHPLSVYGKSLERIRAISYADLLQRRQSGPVTMAGTIISKKERTSGKGNRYAFVQFSDATGMYEAIVFSELLASARELLEVGQSLAIKAGAQFEGDNVRLTVHNVEPLDAVLARAARGLVIRVGSHAPLEPLKAVLAREGGGGGRGQVRLISELDPETTVEIGLPGQYSISPAVLSAVRSIPGILDVREY
ncbi:MAG: DNA polymerase III subunit alpha [Rhodospirillales bacterium]